MNSNGEDLAGGIITISRRKYAAGLFWQPAGGRGNPRDNAAKIARIAKMRASLFVIWNGVIGLAGRRGGIRGGLAVAAPEVVEAFGENTFLAAFSVREGFWVLAVRGGIIIRDKLFGNAGDAFAEYMALNSMPDWAVLVAPSDWNAPSAVERRLDDIVSGNKRYRLSSISHLPGYVMTLAVLAGALFAGYNFFEHPIKKLFAPRPQQLNIDPDLAAEYKRKLDQIDAPPPESPPQTIHVPMPYESLPNLAARADQCWRAIGFLSQQITGWAADTVACMDGEATAHLLRNHGTIGDLYSEVAQKMPGVSISETGGRDVILTARLKSLETSIQPPAYGADEIMTAVQSVFQRINEDIDFRRDFAELQIPKIGDGETLDTDMTDVGVVKIEASSKLQPMEFIKIMNDISSVHLTAVKWDNRGRNWNYDVVIYVK